MAFRPVWEGRVELDREFLEELAELLRRRGVALRATASLAHAMAAEPLNDAEVIDALRATLDAVDASPHPQGEWAPARELLGDELLARLLRSSASSLRRYAAADTDRVRARPSTSPTRRTAPGQSSSVTRKSPTLPTCRESGAMCGPSRFRATSPALKSPICLETFS